MQTAVNQKSSLAQFTSYVYGWVALGLLLTIGVSMFTLSTGLMVKLGMGGLIFLCLAELGLVIWFSAVIQTASIPMLASVYLTYSVLNGITLPAILMHYTSASIVGTFMACLATFTLMSVYGLTTRKDLSGLGPYLFMALMGLIVTYLIDIVCAMMGFSFLTGPMDLIVAGIGVMIFVGFTAYDSQRIKTTFQMVPANGDSWLRHTLCLGLSMYLNFINLFIHLLQFFGESDD